MPTRPRPTLVSSRWFWPTSIGLTLGIAAACSTTSTALSPDHCANNDGDAYCAEQFPDGSKLFCTNGGGHCDVGDRYGCVSAEDLRDGCHDPCGNDPECEEHLDDSTGGETDDPSTSGPASDTTMGSASESDSDSDSSPDCRSDAECEGDTPFCSPQGTCVSCEDLTAPDDACASLFPDTPVCNAGVCVQCTDTKVQACTDSTPACSPDFECAPCTEHFHCPASACHLAGPDQGRCFDVEPQTAADASELDDILNNLGNDAKAVIILTGNTYATRVRIFSGEVAILGQGSPLISGNGTTRAVDVGIDGIAYLAGVQVTNPTGTGIACSENVVWIDDAELHGNNFAGLSVAGCSAYVRRTRIHSNKSSGIGVMHVESQLHLINSVVAGNIGDAAGISFAGATVDITYSTIVANASDTGPHNIQCFADAKGTIRNSIISGHDGSSIIGCEALTWSHNGVDTPGLLGSNELVGPYQAAWFLQGTSFPRLSEMGASHFDGIAQWAEGDPLTDVDGNPIPTETSSHPGWHQPS
jgi:hypothetical protein